MHKQIEMQVTLLFDTLYVVYPELSNSIF